jgi:membrane protein DedA with SNARE-associated domain/rhodanese-related sulfurtransferase
VQQVISFIEQHQLLVLFSGVLATRVGPLPVIPILMTAGGLAGRDAEQLLRIVLVSTGASLIADLGLFWIGMRYGRRLLGWLCRISFSPDFCVRQTETVFTKFGVGSLVFAKFLPGLSLISVAMAGVFKMSLLSFFLLNGVGTLLFVVTSVALGVIFQDAITSALAILTELGGIGVLAIIASVAVYSLFKWWRRMLFIRQLRMDRITVPELRELIDAGQELVILDVRPREARAQDGIIPGALGAHTEDIDPIVKSYPRDIEIVVYCACPNEESAAIAAKHLKQAGFRKIRPLLGGIEAWVGAGQPVVRPEPDQKAA